MAVKYRNETHAAGGRTRRCWQTTARPWRRQR